MRCVSEPVTEPYGPGIHDAILIAVDIGGIIGVKLYPCLGADVEGGSEAVAATQIDVPLPDMKIGIRLDTRKFFQGDEGGNEHRIRVPQLGHGREVEPPHFGKGIVIHGVEENFQLFRCIVVGIQ